MSKEKFVPDAAAINTIIKKLEHLDEPTRQLVLLYINKKFAFRLDEGGVSLPIGVPPPSQQSPAPLTPPVTDIRTLKEHKQPKNDSEMAAVVAYYLKEVTPEAERKDFVTKEDIEKYFKQAGFELPKNPRMTLPVAKNAGYFDQKASGKYKLNPVGHNLVSHYLPGKEPSVGKPRSRKTIKKTESTKKAKSVKSKK